MVHVRIVFMCLIKNMDTSSQPGISSTTPYFSREMLQELYHQKLLSKLTRDEMEPNELLEAAMLIMEGKREDYTTLGTHENFERCEDLVGWFKHDVDKVYVTLIGVKLARLATLLSKTGEPNNESILDSFKDLINYCALWGSRRG
jgi:hypothetical protein